MADYIHFSYPVGFATRDTAAALHCTKIADFLRSHPSAWTQCVYARDRGGQACYPENDEAAAWCSLGLLIRSTMDRNVAAYIGSRLDALIRAKHLGTSVVSWNDHPRRTVEDVIAFFECAAKHLGHKDEQRVTPPDWERIAGTPQLPNFSDAMKKIEAEAVAA